MSDPIDRSDVRPEFWAHVPLTKMTQPEWEALCDGCGKCCLNKLEDEDSGEVVLTRVACKLLDDRDCLCTSYKTRHTYVPECIVLTPSTIQEHMYWLPQTCAYRLLHEGKPLFHWHPLVSGTPQSVHDAGVSVQDLTVSEANTPEDDWEDHIIEEPY
ncbi:YcgN family cysteine cluster protein [Octadecabacter sp. 1_MG-2023]|uniref:YcgN family cysteine cluster protein n=1 Tax=unclassified Octadecabacter TaxID=196158 RepID=UPI001C087A9D|nr:MULTISPECIES: YcgN family cysteine cluster protein [unclassified Octadecabacter]MBU2991922.1 YcgN family cysteine cluster protein [Octadecabacter sp. B2R22]MDO6735896.1 YcgN family cysteine cluster protein [Octadecabacter sp. 1_MG-2023]